MKANHTNTCLRMSIAVMGVALASLSTGCQVHTGGQILPSPWYHQDDVQYFAPGPEFKLAREAAESKAYKEEQEARAR